MASSWDAQDFLKLAGALWGFYGVAVFALIKDYALAERKAPLAPSVLRPVLAVLAIFFLMNWAAIAVFQTLGIRTGLIGHSDWAPAIWPLHLALLLAHLVMSWCAYRAILRAQSAATSGA